MKSKLHVSSLFFCLSLLAAGSVSYAANTSIYSVTKTAVYVQTAAGGAVASPKFPYYFEAQALTAPVLLTLPNASTQPLAPDANNSNDYDFIESFATKPALDTALPDGTYQMSGSGIPTISFSLTPDSYPSTVPYITNGTWNNGVLYVNPAGGVTLNLSDFAAYGTVGVASYMQLGLSDIINGGSSIKAAIISVANPFSITVQSTPLLSYITPSLTSGDIYEVNLEYSNILSFDTTTIPGSGIGPLFENYTTFYIVALASSSTPPPVLASDLAGATGIVGGSATLSATVTVGGSSINGTYANLWYFNGNEINIDGVKYVSNGTSLIVNTLTNANAGIYTAKFVNQGGIVFTDEATLTVLPASAGTPPSITAFSGTTGTVGLGSAVNLSVTASEAGLTLTYQWELNGANISGATNSTYALASAGTANSGDYKVIVSNGYTTSAHDFGTLTVSTAFPSFTLAASPSSVTVASGRSVVFNAIATGTPAPTYQWKLNGSTTIPGATGTNDSVLLVSGATSANIGTYTCTATNSQGSASTSATLAVVTTASPGYLTNLSSRVTVGTGGNILIAGFALAGSGSMDLLLRGVGPALIPAPFGVSGALTNTQLTLYDTVNPNDPLPVVTNSGWSNAFTLGSSTVNVAPQAATLALMNTLGAFTNNWAIGSPDSALEVTPPVGGYTAQISGVGGATGIALAEVYDVDAYNPATRLVNLSTRAQVGTGSNILIGGFVIGGSTAETLLIRAVGPTLAGAPYNVGGTIAQPVLTIYAGSTPIYSNSNWGDDATISTAINTVGAFPLSPTSTDAALLITLPPASNYTAQVSGLNNGTGIALLEVYDVF